MSVSKLSEEIKKAGIDVEVVTTTANGSDEVSVARGIPTLVDEVPVTYYKRITKDHTHFSPSLLSALAAKIQKSKVKNQQPIVHVHAWWNLVSIFAAWVARWKKVPVIISPRGTLSGYSFSNKNSGIKDYIHRFLGKGLLEYSYFHVTSEKEKRDVERLVKPKGVFVIPNFVRIPEEGNGERWKVEGEKLEGKGERLKLEGERFEVKGLEPQNNELSDSEELESRQPLKLLFISRVEEKKGLELLLECLKDIKAEWTLSIAGSGEETYVQKLKQQAEASGISLRITWLGHVSNDQKFDVMAHHDLMVLPSFDENFANVVIECLSVGTAVLLTENVGLADYVETRNLGWVCQRTRDDLMSKLEEAAKNRKHLLAIRENAPSIIRHDFNEAVLVKRYVSMYESVLESERR